MKAMGRVDEAEVYPNKQIFHHTDDDRPPLDPSDRTKEVCRGPRGQANRGD